MSIRHPLTTLVSSALLAFAWPVAAQPVTLEQAQELARRNVDVVIAQRLAAAAQAEIQSADHAPLPQLSARLSQIDLQNGIGSGSLWAGKRIDKAIGLDWTWERGGKQALRTAAARLGADAARADVQEVSTQQVLAAQAAWVDLMAAQLRVAEVDQMAQSARQLAEAALRRVQAGDLAAQDAARAQIEAERALADADAARFEVMRSRLVLAGLIGREEAASTLEAQGVWPPAAADAGRLQAPSASVLGRRADVQAARARVQAAEELLAGAKAQRIADVTWGASMDHYPGTSTRLVELRLQMPLKWGYAYEGEVARALAVLDQARDALRKTEQAASVEIARMHAEAQAANLRSQRFEQQIVPASIEVARRAELAYAKGALSLTDLLDAKRTLRSAQLDALAARADLLKAALAWQLRTDLR